MTVWHKYEIMCANCGKTVIRQNKSETCSIECRDELRKKRKLAASPVDACLGCGEIKPLIYKANDVHVCSKRCVNRVRAAYARSQESWDQAKYRTKRVRPAKMKCAYCGNEFEPDRYNARYCSSKCGDAWAYHYGDKGRNHRKKLREFRQARDEKIGVCALCGVTYDNIVPAKELGWKSKTSAAKFHIDHIVPKANGGDDDDDNLRYLCWFCNLARKNFRPEYDDAIGAAGYAFWQVINKR